MLTFTQRQKKKIPQKGLPNIPKQESNTNYNKKRWNEKEDSVLGHYVSLYGTKWLLISEKMNGRSASQCSQRWKRLKNNFEKDIGIVRKRWTLKEDQLLILLYKKHGPKWKKISKFIPTKDRRSVRNRYTNALDPSLNRDQMTEEEDLKICRLYEAFGSKWSICKISSNFFLGKPDKKSILFFSQIEIFSQPNLYYIKNSKELREQLHDKECVIFDQNEKNESELDINEVIEQSSSFQLGEAMNDQDSYLLEEYDSNPLLLKVK